jgi:Ca2+-binding EF-hand superfamily protein
MRNQKVAAEAVEDRTSSSRNCRRITSSANADARLPRLMPSKRILMKERPEEHQQRTLHKHTQHCMSKDGLAKALAALSNFKHDAGEIEELMARNNMNKNEEIDFNQFCFLVKSNSHIAMLLKSLILNVG